MRNSHKSFQGRLFNLFEKGVSASAARYAIRPPAWIRPTNQLDVTGRAHANAVSFALDYSLVNYKRKLEVDTGKGLLHSKCIQDFRNLESLNLQTNRNLRYETVSNGARQAIELARRKISRILGPLRHGDWVQRCGWGPGSTSTLPSSRSALDNKVSELPLRVSRRAQRYALCYFEHAWSWSGLVLDCEVEGPVTLLPVCFEPVEWELVDSVPKDETKRRLIRSQPTLNLFFQKGVGALIRERLRHVGVDLDDQSLNQRLASVAHISGLATLDLSNASDTVTRELVRLLLPTDWFQLLDDLRCHVVNTGTRGHPELSPVESFSGMGNGFTFELESLIFYALAWVISENQFVSVYGDDIVVESAYASSIVSIFGELGFTINREKSFTVGRFFESCGKHYFDGFDVTPFFQKEEIGSIPSLVRFHNRVFRWVVRIFGGLQRDFLPLLLLVRRLVRRLWSLNRLSGQVPTQPHWVEGDGGLIVDLAACPYGAHIRLHQISFIPLRREAYDRALLCEILRSSSVALTSDESGSYSHSRERVLLCLKGRGKDEISSLGKVTLRAPSNVAPWCVTKRTAIAWEAMAEVMIF